VICVDVGLLIHNVLLTINAQVVTPGEAFVAQARSSPSGQSAEDDPGLEVFSSASSTHR
jgi:hypothetical protein